MADDADDIQRKAEAKRDRQERVKRLCQEMALRKKIEKELRQREIKELEEKKRAYDEEMLQVEAAQQALLRQQQLAEELKKLKIGSSQSRLNIDQERLRMRLSARQATKTE